MASGLFMRGYFYMLFIIKQILYELNFTPSMIRPIQSNRDKKSQSINIQSRVFTYFVHHQ